MMRSVSRCTSFCGRGFSGGLCDNRFCGSGFSRDAFLTCSININGIAAEAAPTETVFSGSGRTEVVR
ncbi:MAG: hypothetical protein ABIW82_02830 [Dokdonella sp.]